MRLRYPTQGSATVSVYLVVKSNKTLMTKVFRKKFSWIAIAGPNIMI